MIDKNKIQEISDKISKIIEDSPISDIEENINALLQSTFTKLNLISREEFDVQTQVLKRTRLKLEDLEKKIDALQTKSKK
jgi:BMFP domain-containing protein YqiC